MAGKVFRLPARNFNPLSKVEDGEIERNERIKAAQSRRDAGAARAKIGISETEILRTDEDKAMASKATIFSKLKGIPTIGAPLRLIEAHFERKREQQRLDHEAEARRVWDMLQHLEPGIRVKLKGLKSKYGGIDYNSQLATVQAGVGNRFSVKLDLVEKDGAVREGQGPEIKIGLHNMTIWDAEVEAVLAAEEAAAKEEARKERDAAIKDLLAFRFRKLLFRPRTNQDVEQTNNNSAETQDGEAPLILPHIEISALGPDSNVDELRTFHNQQRLKTVIRTRDSPSEMYEKIQSEWKERMDALKKSDRDLMDAEAAIRVGMLQPAVRNHLRIFILNSAFDVAWHAMNEARKRMSAHVSQEMYQGMIQSATLDQVTLEQKPVEKGGAVLLDDAYKSHSLQIVQGMGHGQSAIICSYDGAARTLHISIWNTAIPDTSSLYELLGSDLLPFHYQGTAQGGDFESLILAQQADAQKNFYSGMMIRITSGPGKSQVANILRYEADKRLAIIDRWEYDKSLIERALDQDDKDVPIVVPTSQSMYEIQQADAYSGRARALHLRGRIVESNLTSVCLSKLASEKDIYVGKGIFITKGTGRGQKTVIRNYLGAKRLANIAAWKPAIPDKTSRCKILRMDRDQQFFDLYNRLQIERNLAAKKVELTEALRRRKIRTKFRAAAIATLAIERSGQEILRKRQEQNAASWEHYEQESISKAKSNVLFVCGKPEEVTWRSIIFDSVFTENSNAHDSQDKSERHKGLINWKGHLLEAPLYAYCPKDRDGAVEQPIRLHEVESGMVAFEGPTYDWKVWKSLIEDGSKVEGRDDVFLWRGRLVLHPVTAIGDDGEDIFVVVEEQTGLLLHCGPDLESDVDLDILENNFEVDTTDDKGTENMSRDSSILLAMNESMDRRKSLEIDHSEIKIQKTRVRASEIGDLVSLAGHQASSEENASSLHFVGGESWEGPDDPRLWKCLIEESVAVEGRSDVFLWRDTTILQPKREGEYQRVVSEGGDLIFCGLNPNEERDFPSDGHVEEVQLTSRNSNKTMKSGTITTDNGSYTGGLSEGRFQGEGVFTWQNGQIFSGNWLNNVPNGVGTEIFPPYNSKRKDKDGETTFPYYEGQFRNGKRSGKGVYVFASGDKYQGEFREGLFDGHGVFVTARGSFLDCKWRAGLPMSSRIEHLSRVKVRVQNDIDDDPDEPEARTGDDYAFESRAANMDDRYLGQKLTGDGTSTLPSSESKK